MAQEYIIKAKSQTRIRYSEVDSMQYVYYGNYAVFFESGRTELLRQIGTSYKSLEEAGFFFPVVNYQVTYLKPIKYDTLISITTYLKKLAVASITFDYLIENEGGIKVTEASTKLACISALNRKVQRLPDSLLTCIDLSRL